MSEIDPKIEKATRTLLWHALRVEMEDLTGDLQQATTEATIGPVSRLTAQVAAVVCIDLSGGTTPSAEDLQKIAETTAQIDVDYGLGFSQVHDYLARVVFDGETLDAVFEPDDAVFLPFVITANLVASTAGLVEGRDWMTYLDAIEAAIEQAPDPA